MKNILTLLILSVFVQFIALGKGTGPIPTSVVSYVKSHFPKAKNIHWQKHGDNYIAHFVNVKSEVALCLNEKGELLDRITEITAKSELPDSVKNNIDTDRLIYAEKFEGRNGEVFYILELKVKGSEVDEIIFDKQGNRVKEIVIDESIPEEKQTVVGF